MTASFKGIVLTKIWCGVSSLLVKFSKNISVESNKLTVGSVVEEVSVSGDVVGVIAFDLDELEVNIRSNKDIAGFVDDVGESALAVVQSPTDAFVGLTSILLAGFLGVVM